MVERRRGDVPRIADLRLEGPRVTDEFAARVKEIAGGFPDETLLADLFPKAHEFGGTPPEGWQEFVDGLDPSSEKSQLALALRFANREGIVTLGQLREASYRELVRSRWIGPIRASFLLQAFENTEEP